MVLVGSDCFDSFFWDLHAFRKWPSPENCKVMKNLQVLEKNFDGPNSMRWRGLALQKEKILKSQFATHF